MSKEFIKMISELHTERFNVHITDLANKKTPCGIFFGFDFNPQVLLANIQAIVNASLNVTCVLVFVDVQVNAMKNLTNVPIIKLEELSRLDEGIKPHTIFIPGSLKDFALVHYFARYDIEAFRMSNDGQFFFTVQYLPELYSAYEMLGSDESKKVFCAAIKGGVTGKVSDYRFASEPQYCLNFVTIRLIAMVIY